MYLFLIKEIIMAIKSPVTEEQIKQTANALIEKIKSSSSMALSYTDIKKVSQKIIVAIDDENRTPSTVASSGIGLKTIRTAYITNRKELNEINELITKLRNDLNRFICNMMRSTQVLK